MPSTRVHEEHSCSGQVWCPSSRIRGWGEWRSCHDKTVVKRDGKWYCKKHDPVHMAELKKKREDAQNKKWQDERNSRETWYKNRGRLEKWLKRTKAPKDLQHFAEWDLRYVERKH